MNNETMCRRWQLTINNPNDYGFDHQRIKEILCEFKSLTYYCMCDEQGTTHHTHIYFVCANGVRFRTVQERFEKKAHIEYPRGTHKQNRDYITKENPKYLEKAETKIDGTFEEWGELPPDRQGQRTDLDALYDVIASGSTVEQIVSDYPEYIMQIDKIQKAIDVVNSKRNKTQLRDVWVNYVYGVPRSGKTSFWYGGRYDYSEVYRISNYNNPWDNYQSEKVVILDEFRSSLPLEFMLNVMDRYPLQLPSRYNNKWASFTEVIIISNMPLYSQYSHIQKSDQITKDLQFKAFLDRINTVWVFNDTETYQPEFFGTLEKYNEKYDKLGYKKISKDIQLSLNLQEEIPF